MGRRMVILCTVSCVLNCGFYNRSVEGNVCDRARVARKEAREARGEDRAVLDAKAQGLEDACARKMGEDSKKMVPPRPPR